MQRIENVLFALVLVGAPQRVDGDELLQGLLDGAGAEDVDAEVEDVVERVAVVAAALAGHSRAELPTEELVNPGRLCELWVDFSGVLHKMVRTRWKEDGKVLTESILRDMISAERLWHSARIRARLPGDLVVGV